MTIIIILATLQTMALIAYVGVVIWAVRILTADKSEPPKPIFKPKDKPIKETEEQRKQRLLDENVEKYDGTGKGQTKI